MPAPLPMPDAIIAPKEHLGEGMTESDFLKFFAHNFRRDPEVLEIFEIPGEGAYLIGPVGVSIRYASGRWTWHQFPSRIQHGYYQEP